MPPPLPPPPLGALNNDELKNTHADLLCNFSE